MSHLEKGRPCHDNKGRERGGQEHDGDEEAVEPGPAHAGAQGDEHDVSGGRKNAAQTLALDHGTHVGWRELGRDPGQTALGDGNVDVDEDHAHEGQEQEHVLKI